MRTWPLFISGACLAAVLFWLQPAQAYTIPGPINVGEVDPLREVALLPSSGEQTEIDYVTQALASLGVDYEGFTIKIDDLVAVNTLEDPNIIAADITPYDDEYFLVKNSTAWALHENLSELFYAVLDTDYGAVTAVQYDYDSEGDLVAIGAIAGTYADLLNLSSTRLEISHISVYGGSGEQDDPGDDPGDDPAITVPEPGPLALMSLGLLGIGFTRRFV